MVQRLIDADKLADEFYHMPELVYTDAIARCIEMQPTVDAVQVVRCKDCKYAKHDTEYLIDENLYYCVWHEETHNPNWYCADGELKDGEHDVWSDS